MAKKAEPRHFYLNEQHELGHEARESGGSLPKLAPIDWSRKQRTIAHSLANVRQSLEASKDPLRGKHYFLIAKPERVLSKLSDDKRKAPTGRFDDPVDFAGKDAKVLGRLNLDVLSVTELGAIVHATPERFERLETIGANLAEVGRVEQARWASVSSFDSIPDSLRADQEWLDRLKANAEYETIVELQPLLTRTEGSLVLTDIAERLNRAQGEAILGSGTDFSGRGWVRTQLRLKTILEIVRRYFSVQSVHEPLLSSFLEVGTSNVGDAPLNSSVAASNLPVVAVVDSGVPTDHAVLSPYRRGTFIDPDSPGVLGNHGTFVASRVVFGDPQDPVGTSPAPSCRFLDVVVPRDAGSADDKIFGRAINVASANFPDVRTYNLSFGDRRAYGEYPAVERANRLQVTQELDNIIFARDILVVVAAGNVAPGVAPSHPYPESWRDSRWGLGHLALGFNTLTCGSHVAEWTLLGGLASVPLAPSPFSKVGPGLAGSPVPDFGAHGGNATATYGTASGLGVYGLSLGGLWEDRAGTSFAAPLLARECAMAFSALQSVCPPGSTAFSVTVKALLALTAQPTFFEGALGELASLSLGRGIASHHGLVSADPSAAMFVWQGTIQDKVDIAKIMLPIPLQWIKSAKDPVAELSISWDTPANAAFPSVYGCRRVDAKLRATASGKAARPSAGVHAAYPLRVRTHSLKSLFRAGHVHDDFWMIELSYDEECDYPPTQAFTPEQRVGVAVRLRDRAGTLSPQEFVQVHPLAATMNRLSVVTIPSSVPVTIKTP